MGCQRVYFHFATEDAFENVKNNHFCFLLDAGNSANTFEHVMCTLSRDCYLKVEKQLPSKAVDFGSETVCCFLVKKCCIYS